jgi:hypothetical protein
MLTKTIIALAIGVVTATSLASVANAQRQGVQPFTAAEQNWFDTAEGPERFPKVPK